MCKHFIFSKKQLQFLVTPVLTGRAFIVKYINKVDFAVTEIICLFFILKRNVFFQQLCKLKCHSFPFSFSSKYIRPCLDFSVSRLL